MFSFIKLINLRERNKKFLKFVVLQKRGNWRELILIGLVEGGRRIKEVTFPIFCNGETRGHAPNHIALSSVTEKGVRKSWLHGRRVCAWYEREKEHVHVYMHKTISILVVIPLILDTGIDIFAVWWSRKQRCSVNHRLC